METKEQRRENRVVFGYTIAAIIALAFFTFGGYMLSISSSENEQHELEARRLEITDARKALDNATTESARLIARRELEKLLDEDD